VISRITGAESLPMGLNRVFAYGGSVGAGKSFRVSSGYCVKPRTFRESATRSGESEFEHSRDRAQRKEN